jgi:hypothetical protein
LLLAIQTTGRTNGWSGCFVPFVIALPFGFSHMHDYGKFAISCQASHAPSVLGRIGVTGGGLAWKNQ